MTMKKLENLVKQNLFEMAQHEGESMKETHKNKQEYHLLMMAVYEENQSFDKAAKSVDNLIETVPNNAALYAQKGKYLRKFAEKETQREVNVVVAQYCLSKLEDVVDKLPSVPQNKFTQYLQTGLAFGLIAPVLPIALAEKACKNVYKKVRVANAKKESLKAYDTAISIDPKAEYFAGALDAAKDNWRKKYEIASQAFDQFPTDSYFAKELASACGILGKKEDAKNLEMHSIKLYIDEMDSRLHPPTIH